MKTGEKPNVPVAVKLERNKMMVKVTGEGLVLVKDGVRTFFTTKIVKLHGSMHEHECYSDLYQ